MKEVTLTNIDEWITANKNNFVPPVSNYFLQRDGQLTVMFVGGPNNRSDFHIQEGEEFFYQLKGNALLKTIVQGKHKDIVIKEGNVLLLPRRIPHSPQRFAESMGLVLERKRAPNEFDILRFYVSSEEGLQQEILYQTTFHWDNVDKDIPRCLKEFSRTEQCHTGKPQKDVKFDSPFDVNHESDVEEPIELKKWIASNEDSINQQGRLELFDTKMYKHEIYVYGAGYHVIRNDTAQIWILQLEGKNKVNSLNCQRLMRKHDSLLVEIGTYCEIWQEKGGYFLACCQHQ